MVCSFCCYHGEANFSSSCAWSPLEYKAALFRQIGKAGCPRTAKGKPRAAPCRIKLSCAAVDAALNVSVHLTSPAFPPLRPEEPDLLKEDLSYLLSKYGLLYKLNEEGEKDEALVG